MKSSTNFNLKNPSSLARRVLNPRIVKYVAAIFTLTALVATTLGLGGSAIALPQITLMVSEFRAGDVVKFTVTSDRPVTSDLTIRWEFRRTPQSAWVSHNSSIFEIKAGEDSASSELPFFYQQLRLIPDNTKFTTETETEKDMDNMDITVGVTVTNTPTTVDMDNPGMTIENSGSDAIAEGFPIQFELQSVPLPITSWPASHLNTDKEVIVHVSQGTGEDFIDEVRHPLNDDGIHVVTQTVEKSTGKASFKIYTKANLDSTDSGTITATVQSGTGFVVGTRSKTVSISITNSALPVLSISAPESVTEGETVNFKVTANAPVSPGSSFAVEYEPEETGDFIDISSYTASPLNFMSTSTSGIYEATIPFTIPENSAETENGSVTVTLKDDPGPSAEMPTSATYVVTHVVADQFARVVIKDNDLPELSIAPASADPVVEAETAMATFMVTSSINPGEAVEVYYTATETSDNDDASFLLAPDDDTNPTNNGHVSGVMRNVEMTFAQNGGSGPYIYMLQIPLVNDNTEEDGEHTIKVQLDSDQTNVDYRVAIPVMNVDMSQASVTVIDDDSLPILTLSLPEFHTGSNFNALISSDRDVGADGLTVTYELTEDGSTWSESNQNVNLTQASNNMQMISVPQRYTALRLVLKPTEFRTELDGNYGKAVQSLSTMVSSTTPGLSIEHTGSGSVIEGERIEFRVFATPSVFAANLTSVPVRISQGMNDNFIDESAHALTGNTHTYTIPTIDKDTGEVKFTIRTKVNVSSENDGAITATIPQDTGQSPSYVVGTRFNAVSVQVVNNPLPILSIEAAGEGEATEGGSAEFTVIAKALSAPANGENFPVNIEIREGGTAQNNSLYSIDTSVTTKTLRFIAVSGEANTYSAGLSIPIPSNTDPNVRGSVTVSLTADQSPANYQVSNVSGEESAMVLIFDDDVTELTIESTTEGDLATEGVDSTITFKVSARNQPSAATLPNTAYTVSDPDGYLASTRPVLNFTDDGNGNYSATLSLTINDNNNKDTNGTAGRGDVTVTLQNATPLSNYSVSPVGAESIATVEVYDDDSLPNLTISADGDKTVIEGRTANFTVSASVVQPEANMVLHYSVTQTEGFFTAGTNLMRTIPSFSTTSTSDVFETDFDLTTLDNSRHSPAGSVTVTLEADTQKPPKYIVVDTGNTDTVKVFDRTVPEFRISGDGPVTEAQGAQAVFTVTSSIPVPGIRKVNYEASGNRFIGMYTSPFSLAFNGGNTAKLTIPLISDDIPEMNQDIVVTLKSTHLAAVYNISQTGNENTATVLVIDDDSLPVVSVSSEVDEIFEGESTVNLDFTVTAEFASDPSPLRIRYIIEKEGDFVAASVQTDMNLATDSLTFNPSGTGTYSAVLVSIPIASSTVGQASGSVSVTILSDDATGITGLPPNDSHTYAVKDSPGNKATVKVFDKDIPELSIAGGDRVIESDDAQNPAYAEFSVTASVAPSGPIAVRYKTTEMGSVLHSTTNPTAGHVHNMEYTTTPPLSFAQVGGTGPYVATISIQVESDTVVESGELAITVELLDDDSGLDYTVIVTAVDTGPQKSASVNVLDNDVPPTLSIAATGEGEALEGENAEFTVTAVSAGKPGGASTFPITISISEGGRTQDNNLYSIDTTDTTKNLTFSAVSGEVGKYSAPLTVAIPQNNNANIRGSVTVTIEDDTSPADYLVSDETGANQATVAIFDDDAPELTIESTTMDNAATEGVDSTITFKVSARNKSNADPLPNTAYDVSDPEGYLTNSRPALNFTDDGDGNYSATLTLDIDDDQTKDTIGNVGVGTVSVTLQNTNPLADYSVSPVETESKASVEITDDDSLPLLTIAADEQTKTIEGSDASFIITATVAQPAINLVLRYSVSQTGDFITAGDDFSQTIPSFSTTGTAGMYNGKLDLSTNDNNREWASGTITVAVAADTQRPAKYIVADSGFSATAKVFDKDIPELSIAGVGSVTEAAGAMAMFTVTSSIVVAGSIDVYYNVGQNSFTGTPTIPFSLDFKGGNTAILTVPLESDSQKEGGQDIVVTLAADQMGTDYTVSPTAGEFNATVRAIDDDSLPLLSVTTEVAQIFEGDATVSLDFIVIAEHSENPGQLRIRYIIEEEGDFVDSTVQTGVNLATSALTFSASGAGTYRASLVSIPIVPDSTNESSGSVSVTLLSDDVAGINGLPPNAVHTYKVKDAPANKRTVKVLDNDAPELSIAGGALVVESNDQQNPAFAEFTVTASFQPVQPIAVQYRTTEMGSVLHGTINPTTGHMHGQVYTTSPPLDFNQIGGTGPYVAAIRIQVESDQIVETGELAITVELLADDSGTDYTVISPVNENDSQNSASVPVLDDDTAPVLAISAVGEGEVIEGEMAQFIVTAISARDLSVGLTFPVTVEISEGGNMQDGSFYSVDTTDTAKNLQFEAISGESGKYSAMLSVIIPQNTNANIRGSVTVAIAPDTSPEDYLVSEEVGANQAKVVIFDDDTSELSIESTTLDNVATEGINAAITFKISARNLSGEATIPNSAYAVSDPDGYLTSERPALNFTDEGDGNYSAILTLNIADNDTKDTNGTAGKGEVSVTLQNATPIAVYTVSPVEAEAMASVVVTDDDSLPVLSLSADGDKTVIEEEQASFTISATVAQPPANIVVHYSLTQTGNFITAGDNLSRTIPSFATAATAGEFVGDFDFATVDNGIEGASGLLTVTLAADTQRPPKYIVAATGISDTVKVFDKDVPELSITGDGPVAEAMGATAMFTVTSSLDVTGVIEIHYTATGDRFIGTPTVPYSLDFASGRTASLPIPLVSDGQPEQEQEIVVTLTADEVGTDYTVSQSGNEKTASVLVADADATVVISFKESQSNYCNIDSSDNSLSCSLSESVTPLPIILAYTGVAAQTVSVSAATSAGTVTSPNLPALKGTDYDTDDGIKQFDVVTRELNFPITIIGNEAIDGSKMFQVVFSSPMNAEFAGSATTLTARITILDDDGRVVRITANDYSINEGETVVFTLSSNSDTDMDNIPIRFSQEGGYVFAPVRRSVDIAGGESVSISVDTVDDTVDGNDGWFELSIMPTSEFSTIPSGGSVRIIVMDNDTENTTPYSVAASVITSILLGIPATPGESKEKSQSEFPVISITALADSVSEGQYAPFKLNASRPSELDLSINVELEEIGEFIGGGRMETVQLPANAVEATHKVLTVDDDIAERDGSVIATVLSGEDYLVGQQNRAAVVITDESDRLVRQTEIQVGSREVLSQVMVSVGARTLDAVSDRIAYSFTGSGSDSTFKLRDTDSLTAMLKSGGQMLNEGGMNWQEVLGVSSFTVNLLPEQTAAGSTTIWGNGDHRELSGDGHAGSQSWEGDILTGQIGFDTRIGQGMLAGLTTSATQSEFLYGKNGGTEMLYDTRTTGLHPYLGYTSIGGNMQLQVMTGYGTSEIVIDQEKYEAETFNGTFHTLGLGGNGNIYSSDSIVAGGSSSLNVSGQSWLARQNVNALYGIAEAMQVSASHIRLAVKGSHDQNFASGDKLTPSISFGLRGDGLDDMTTYGLELTSGVKYSSPYGLTVSGSGETLMSGLNQIHEWELRSSMDYDSDSDKLGVLLSVSPKWGGARPDEHETIWNSNILDVSGSSTMFTDGHRFESELGYGFRLGDGQTVVTPYGGMEMSNAGSNELSIGSRFTVSSQFNFKLESVRSTSVYGETDTDYRIDGSLHW